MVALESFAWVFSLLEAVGSLMPFGSFGVAKNSSKSFECFDAKAILAETVVFVLKAVLSLLMSGQKPEACPIVCHAVSACCFCISSSACALLVFVSFLSGHGVKHEVVRLVCLILVVLAASMGWVMYLIEELP